MGDLIRRDNTQSINGGIKWPEIPKLNLPSIEETLSPSTNPTGNPGISGNPVLDIFFGQEKLGEYLEKYPMTSEQNIRIWQNEIDKLPNY